jgi:NhaP-type Na+/H+ and K+/H+ antiporter
MLDHVFPSHIAIMSLTTENIVLIGSMLLFISIIVGKTTYKFGVPTLILFLAIGMLAGSDGIGGIHFDDPKLAQLVGIIALNFILFSGGLDTSWATVKPVLKEGLVLSTVGVLLTALSLGTIPSASLPPGLVWFCSQHFRSAPLCGLLPTLPFTKVYY